MHAGQRLMKEVANGPVQVMGTVNAMCAKLAQKAGAKAIYLSGAGVANASVGLPDLGVTNLNDVVIDIERITAVCDLPLLVDADTGWGSVLNVGRSAKLISKAGAAGMHIEDQVLDKRCGHRAGKQLVSTDIMCDRIKAAVDERIHADFVIMARTDAVASEGIDSAIDRANAYVAAGARMIFAEAVTSLDDYRKFTSALTVPVLANITEFGKTPLFTVRELDDVGIQLILYPLSAFRAMNFAAYHTYCTLVDDGTQKSLLDSMQTRDELYELLNYERFEALISD